MKLFQKESKSVVGALIALVAFFLSKYGGFTENEAAIVILNVMQVAGVLFAWYGRYKAGGINIFGWRKTTE